MHYRSVDDLQRDVIAWADRLPQDLGLVVALPRSGLLPATMLALHLSLPLADVEGFLAGRTLGAGRRGVREGREDGGTVLVVDDSVDSGVAMRAARQAVREQGIERRVVFGAVYASKEGRQHVDVFHSVVPMPRVFQWNVLHHPLLTESCMEIEGVLCRPATPGEQDDPAAYGEYLSKVPARLVPHAQVAHLVTARQARHRAATERWLARAGVRYRELHMAPDGATPQEAAAFKARLYKDSRAPLFVEGPDDVAAAVADGSGKPVFSTVQGRMLYPGGAAHVTPLQDVRWSTLYRAERLARRLVQRVPAAHEYLRRRRARS